MKFCAIALGIALLVPTAIQAGPNVEQRCVDLGSDCVCSEPLDFLETWQDGWHNPPDTDGVGAKECKASGVSVKVGREQTNVTAASVGLSGPTYVMAYLNEDSTGKLDDEKLTFTNGTWCSRVYTRFSAGFTAPVDGFQNIKFGRNEKPNPGPHPGSETTWGHVASGLPSGSFFTSTANYQGSDFGEDGSLGRTGDSVTLQDCMDSWCMVEMCYDHNVGSDQKLRRRARVTNLSNGDVQLLGPETSSGTAATAHSGDTTRVFSSKTGEGGYSTEGEYRYFSYAMIATQDTADVNFWIGAASEIEEGAASESSAGLFGGSLGGGTSLN